MVFEDIVLHKIAPKWGLYALVAYASTDQGDFTSKPFNYRGVCNISKTSGQQVNGALEYFRKLR